MLEEFRNIYTIHRWVRCVTWLGILSMALCFVWEEGGFPARAWLEFIQAIWHVHAHGSAIFDLLWGPGLWSVVWLIAWILLLWSSLWLVRQGRRQSGWQEEEREGAWSSSQHLSLALSSVGGHLFMDEALTAASPRLRLPQKSPQGSAPARAIQNEPARTAIQDIPTRPGGHVPPKKARQLSMQPLQIGIGWNSGIERRHKPNEDSMLVLQATCTYQGQLTPFGLFAIADGMGGHECGLDASRLAIQNMLHTVLQNIIMGDELSDEFLADMLIGGVEWANQAIRHRAHIDGKDMGTTLTAALVVGMKAYVVNVGDSRTYVFREGEGLRQITQDHSLVASLVARGEIKPEEVYTHPERNKVYRSLGYTDDLQIDCFTVALRAYDRLFLCSDGLWEMVRDPQLERVLRSSDDLPFVSDSLVQAALRGGGVDNISVIVVQIPYKA